MPTQLLSIGSVHTILQNVVYALPARPSIVTTSAACETSINGTTWTAFTSGGTTTAKFIRSAGVNTLVSVGEAVAGAGGGAVSGDIAVTSVSTGAIPALTGQVRMSNGTAGLKIRHSNNTSDVNLARMNGSSIEYGDPSVDMGLAAGTVYLQAPLNINASGGTSALLMSARISAAPAGLAGFIQLYMKSNGTKMVLWAVFPTGAPVQIAIEP